jgi:hypothetical protein
MTDESSVTPQVEVKVGRYTLKAIIVPVDMIGGTRVMAPHVWMQHENGEGMSVHEKIFTKFIDDLFRGF